MSEIALFISEDDGGTRRVVFTRSQLIARRILVIGRDSRCDIVVDDRRVSRVHAALDFSEVTGECLLVDLCSTHGTRLNGKAVSAEGLMPGEAFVIGDATRIVLEQVSP